MGKGNVTPRMVLNAIVVVGWIIVMAGSLFQIIQYGYGDKAYMASIVFTLGAIGAAILLLVALAQAFQHVAWVKLLTHALPAAGGFVLIASSLRQMIEYGYRSIGDTILFTATIVLGAALIVMVSLRLARLVNK